MSDLMAEVAKFTDAKRAAQDEYLKLLTGLNDEQFAAVVAAATPEAAAAVESLNIKAMDAMEQHPLAEHLANVLGDSAKEPFEVMRAKVWELVERDNRRYNAALTIFTAPQVVLMFGEHLSDAEKDAALAPWRAALGAAAGV